MKMPTEKYNVIEYSDATGLKYQVVLYACGHCSAQRQVESVHVTPDYRCGACWRWLCESPLCHARCTPLYALAKDRFEGAGKWGALVPAIMAGASTPEEAILLGLPKETFNA